MSEKVISRSDEVRDQRHPGWSWFDDKLVKENGKDLGPTGIAVYMVLCTFADNKTQQCYPSHKTIASILGISRPTVKKYLEKLRDAGWITWDARHGKDGARTSNCYTLLPPPSLPLQNEQYQGGVKETYPGRESQFDTNHTHDNQNNTHASNRKNGSGQSDPRANFSMLRRICKINTKTMTPTQRGKLNQVEKHMREEVGVTTNDLERFGLWWYRHHWKGKDGQAPRPMQIREDWGLFEDWRKSRESRQKYVMEAGR